MKRRKYSRKEPLRCFEVSTSILHREENIGGKAALGAQEVQPCDQRFAIRRGKKERQVRFLTKNVQKSRILRGNFDDSFEKLETGKRNLNHLRE